MDTDNANVSSELFDTLVILEFSVKVPPPAIQWIVDKIKLLKSKGGGELQVCPIVDENHEVCCYCSCCLVNCTFGLCTMPLYYCQLLINYKLIHIN